MDIFGKASHAKLRFHVDLRQADVRSNFVGTVTVEDLWDFSVAELEAIGIAQEVVLAEKATVVTESRFQRTTKKVDPEQALSQLRVEILKVIYDTKLAELEAKKATEDKKARRAQLLQLKAQKENEAMLGMSLEDIDKQLAELED